MALCHHGLMMYDPNSEARLFEMSDEVKSALEKVKQIYVTEHTNNGMPSMVILFNNLKLPRDPVEKTAMCEELYKTLQMDVSIYKGVDIITMESCLPLDTVTDDNFPMIEGNMPLPVHGMEFGMNPRDYPRLPYAIKMDSSTGHTVEDFRKIAKHWQDFVSEHHRATENVTTLFPRGGN